MQTSITVSNCSALIFELKIRQVTWPASARVLPGQWVVRTSREKSLERDWSRSAYLVNSWFVKVKWGEYFHYQSHNLSTMLWNNSSCTEHLGIKMQSTWYYSTNNHSWIPYSNIKGQTIEQTHRFQEKRYPLYQKIHLSDLNHYLSQIIVIKWKLEALIKSLETGQAFVITK